MTAQVEMQFSILVVGQDSELQAPIQRQKDSGKIKKAACTLQLHAASRHSLSDYFSLKDLAIKSVWLRMRPNLSRSPLNLNV
jgi:hypothetical protein